MSTTLTEVETVIAEIQAALPTIEMIAGVAASLIPGGSTAAAFLPIVENYLNEAFTAFETLAPTMAANAAQPIVTEIVDDLEAALAEASKIVPTLAPPDLVTFLQTVLTEAEAVVASIGAFATGVTGAAKPATPRMRVRGR